MRKKRFVVPKQFLFSEENVKELKELSDYFEVSESEFIRLVVSELYKEHFKHNIKINVKGVSGDKLDYYGKAIAESFVENKDNKKRELV